MLAAARITILARLVIHTAAVHPAAIRRMLGGLLILVLLAPARAAPARRITVFLLIYHVILVHLL
jgi:hypothetical protein